MSTDTIAAISTGGSNSGINIIRISGTDAFKIVSEIFTNYKSLGHQKIVYGKIRDPKTLKVIDEVLVSQFCSPNSYTGEDVCEINTHGGRAVTHEVLELVLKCGAKIAEAGEFSKRAFLNGKMDLSKAEAIIDIINAKTKIQTNFALSKLEGGLKDKVNSIRQSLIDLMAQIEVNIDYPEYEYGELSKSVLKSILERIDFEVNKMLQDSQDGKYMKDGVNLAIIGGTNAGKSSLLNALSKSDRAIVTDIEGTTRDVVEETVVVGNLVLNISDTAGIRETTDIVEKIGVEKSLKCIETSDLIIYLLDSTKGLSSKDKELISTLRELKKTYIVCMNKIDMCKEVLIDDFLNSEKYLEQISCLTGEGTDHLKKTIQEVFNAEDISQFEDKIIVNERHKDLLQKASQSIQKALLDIENDMSLDIPVISLNEALQNLGEITGESVTEDVINRIFEKFCLGK
jgi:tRNA modification GTPase